MAKLVDLVSCVVAQVWGHWGDSRVTRGQGVGVESKEEELDCVRYEVERVLNWELEVLSEP